MTAPAQPKTDAESFAELYRTRGPKWRARDLTIELRAPATDDTPDDGLIPVTLSSEAPVARYDWWTGEEYVEVLDHKQTDLGYARDGLPFFLDHRSSLMIGLIENVRVDAKSKTLRGEVRQGSHPDAEWAFKDIRNGIRKKVSVGYITGDYQQEKTKKDEVPTRYCAWMPIEGSSVPIPADYEVGFDGRSQLRALRTDAPARPEPTRTPEEPMPAPGTDDAAVASVEKERAANESLRQEALGVLAESYTEVVDVKTLRGWQSDTSMTPEKARGFILTKIGERSKTETQGVTTGSGNDTFARVEYGGEQGTKHGPFLRASDQWEAVRLAASGNTAAREKLGKVRAASGSNEAVQSEGGFLVQVDHSENLMQRVYNTGQVAQRCTRLPIGANANGIVMNVVKETSRVDGSRFGGVRGYWLNEADQITGSKPEFRQLEQRLSKLGALVYTTDELLADSTALAGVINNAVPKELNFKLEDGIWEGTGAGQPLGITNAKADGVISIAKENGQQAATIQVENLAKMWARKFGNEADFVWFVNQDTFPQLQTLQVGTGTAATLVYMPAGGISGKPFGTIYGAPVIPIEYCSTLGTVGDIVLADLSQYLVIDKGGVQSAESMHVKFLTDEMAYRFIYRVNGQPMWNAPLTPFKGTNTVSPFITLATRA